MDSNDVTLRQTLSASKPKTRGWVQTERAAHEAWALLTAKKPRAAMLLHYLVAQMGSMNAVVISQDTLAKLMGVNVRTVSRAVKDLVEGRWIEVVRLGKGKDCAYVVNSRVAWGQKREDLKLSFFQAVVVANYDEQIDYETGELRRIPTLYPGERQLPSGEGEPPPSQPLLGGFEPDLPARTGGSDFEEREQLERAGQKRIVP